VHFENVTAGLESGDEKETLYGGENVREEWE